jgi:tetratricopeptide (TPR) repeat protein
MANPAFTVNRITHSLLARGAVLLALGLFIVALFGPMVMTVLHNNLGSVALNRALLTPDLTEEERVAQALHAGKAFQMALAWDLLNGQAYYNLAAIYDLWADPPSAARALARAAALLPRDAVAQLKHGLALADRGQELRALEAWETAEAATYFVARGQALAAQGDHEGALQQYRRAVTIDPHMAEAYLRLGQALSRLGREEEALDALASAAAYADQASALPYLQQAEVHVAREEWTAALAAFREAARLSPQDPEPHYRRGWVLSEKLGDDEAALACFEEALALDPEHKPSRLALGRLHAARGECDAAARRLDPLLSQDPNDGSVGKLHILLAECLLEQGRTNEALSHLEQARSLDPQAPSILLRLGQGYSQAGRFQDAIEAYLRVIELAPQGQEAQEAREALEELGWSETTGAQQ